MLLWNDYEGKTIAGKYVLGPLLGPEGRSALFSLPEGLAAIAVTESLNDEDQMLACWAKIAAVKQENLITLGEFGRTELDGTPLTYVVMEASDGNLADLLKERVLTHEEAMQIAVSLSAALGVLHRERLAHGHVVAENVVAVGETVKLRTDCVRECGGKATEEEWADLVWKDVQGLVLVLLRGLTLEKKLSPETRLPAPFDRVVEKGINGTWGLAEIVAAVSPPVVKPLAPVTPVQYNLPEVGPEPVVLEDVMPVRRVEVPMVSFGSSLPFGLDWKRLAAAVGGLVVLVLLCLHFLRGKPEAAAAAPVVPGAVAAPVTAPAKASVTAPAVVAAGPRPVVAGHMKAGWYVIAYTYNREDQAWKKAATIRQRHPALEPEVIAPGGHGPFLVAIGGPMTRDGAESARSKALQEGLPRDTYVRNYQGS